MNQLNCLTPQFSQNHKQNPKREEENKKNYNCWNNKKSPVGGQCLTKNVINQQFNLQTQKTESFNHTKPTHLKTQGRKTRIWYQLEILSKAHPFIPSSGLCQLCTKAKFTIIYEPHLATLNSRNEVKSCCRHKKRQLLRKFDPKRA